MASITSSATPSAAPSATASAEPCTASVAAFATALAPSLAPTPAPTPTVRVQAGSFLTLHYRLAGPAGDIINTFDGQPATLTLGTGELAPAVEARLIGLEEGERASFDIPAGEAFGDRAPDMVQWVARKLLDQMGQPGEEYAVGDVVQFPTPDGLGTYAGAVRQVALDAQGKADAVLFDFNHPLASQSVTFEVDVIGIL